MSLLSLIPVMTVLDWKWPFFLQRFWDKNSFHLLFTHFSFLPDCICIYFSFLSTTAIRSSNHPFHFIDTSYSYSRVGTTERSSLTFTTPDYYCISVTSNYLVYSFHIFQSSFFRCFFVLFCFSPNLNILCNSPYHLY